MGSDRIWPLPLICWFMLFIRCEGQALLRRRASATSPHLYAFDGEWLNSCPYQPDFELCKINSYIMEEKDLPVSHLRSRKVKPWDPPSKWQRSSSSWLGWVGWVSSFISIIPSWSESSSSVSISIIVDSILYRRPKASTSSTSSFSSILSTSLSR